MSLSQGLVLCILAFSLNLWLNERLQSVASSDASAPAGPEGSDVQYKPGLGLTKNQKPLSILMISSTIPGHIYPIVTLGAELVKRGHNVTLCTTVMEGSNLLPDLPESYGINFVSAGDDYLTQDDYNSLVKGFQNVTSLSNLKLFISIVSSQSHMLTRKVNSKVDEIGVDKFDFIVSEIITSNDGVYYARLGKRLMMLSNAFSEMDATTPEWPSPMPMLGQSVNVTFFQRLVNTLIVKPVWRFVSIFIYSTLDNKYRQVLKSTDLLSYVGVQVPLVMTTMFGLDYPKTRFPLTHYVGPLMMDSFTPLEQQLLEWLSNKPNKTVIYFGMGASGFITPYMAQLIMDGILATDFSVVWALPMSDQDVLEGIDIDRERFYISKWIPRQTLFKHPTLVMTILHCAMNSVQESLYNGLPVVCVPYAFDHFDMANKVDSAKVGIPLYSMMDSLRQRNTFTSENLTIAIKTITETKEYTDQVKKIRNVFKFAGGVKRAADLVELYSEVGYDHLIPAYAKYEWSWVQYYNVDVYCVLSLLGCLLFYVFYRSLKCCCKCFYSKAKKPKLD